MKLTGYYIPGVQFVCRFCSTSLMSFKDGIGKPLGNIRHMTVAIVENDVKTRQMWRFTCCAACVKSKAKQYLIDAFAAEKAYHGFSENFSVDPTTLTVEQPPHK